MQTPPKFKVGDVVRCRSLNWAFDGIVEEVESNLLYIVRPIDRYGAASVLFIESELQTLDPLIAAVHHATISAQ